MADQPGAVVIWYVAARSRCSFSDNVETHFPFVPLNEDGLLMIFTRLVNEMSPKRKPYYAHFEKMVALYLQITTFFYVPRSQDLYCAIMCVCVCSNENYKNIILNSKLGREGH